MNEAMKYLHTCAAQTARMIQARKSGWPQASRWFGRCRLGTTRAGREQSFIKLRSTELWLGRDGKLYNRIEKTLYRPWGQHADRSPERIEQIIGELQRLQKQ